MSRNLKVLPRAVLVALFALAGSLALGACDGGGGGGGNEGQQQQQQEPTPPAQPER